MPSPHVSFEWVKSVPLIETEAWKNHSYRGMANNVQLVAPFTKRYTIVQFQNIVNCIKNRHRDPQVESYFSCNKYEASNIISKKQILQLPQNTHSPLPE